jgi:hypothetical protein
MDLEIEGETASEELSNEKSKSERERERERETSSKMLMSGKT